MVIPSVDNLKRPTLELLAGGLTDSDQIRSRIARDFQVDPAATPRFTNNHAWALVRLQQNGLIQKLALKSYIITELGRAWLRDAGLVQARPPEPPVVGAMPAWASRLIHRANLRNGADGPPFTQQDLVALWDDCNGRCKITRLEFSDEKVGRGQAKRAYAPSLDRINPEEPYTVANCRLVMVAVNFALNAWGDDVYMKLARAAVAAANEKARTTGR
jgi:hypothetical protein